VAYSVFRSAAVFFVSLAAGILIDIDHIFDYYTQEGPTLKIKKIYSWCLENKFKSVFFYFHSVELLFLLWLSISLFKLGLLWIAIAIGLTQHLILDILFNRNVFRYGYFLSYRIIKGFRKECILR